MNEEKRGSFDDIEIVLRIELRLSQKDCLHF